MRIPLAVPKSTDAHFTQSLTGLPVVVCKPLCPQMPHSPSATLSSATLALTLAHHSAGWRWSGMLPAQVERKVAESSESRVFCNQTPALFQKAAWLPDPVI